MKSKPIKHREPSPLDIKIDIRAPHKLHWHAHVEILYCAHGTLNIRLQSKDYYLEQGDLLVAASNAAHEITDLTPFIGYMLRFLSYIPYSGIAGFDKTLILRKEKTDFFWELLGKIRENMPPGTLPNNFVRAYLSLLAAHIENAAAPEDVIIQRVYADSADDAIHNLVQHLQHTFTQEWSVERAARFTQLSHDYFAHKFKKITGTSFARHIAELRLDKACNLLTETPKTIALIAEECGWNTVNSLNREFRLRYGMPPTKWRGRPIEGS